jgi:hypothetical protein
MAKPLQTYWGAGERLPQFYPFLLTAESHPPLLYSARLDCLSAERAEANGDMLCNEPLTLAKRMIGVHIAACRAAAVLTAKADQSPPLLPHGRTTELNSRWLVDQQGAAERSIEDFHRILLPS